MKFQDMTDAELARDVRRTNKAAKYYANTNVVNARPLWDRMERIEAEQKRRYHKREMEAISASH